MLQDVMCDERDEIRRMTEDSVLMMLLAGVSTIIP